MRLFARTARKRGSSSAVSPSISISANDNTVSVAQGLTTTITYTLTRIGGYTDTVTPAVTGLPSGVTGGWSDSSLTGADTTTILTLTADVAAGLVTNDAFTVTFSGSGVSDAVDNGTVTVTAELTWTAGAGANAPSWVGKTVYPTQQFATALPVHYASPTAEGFKGFQGFPNCGDEVWLPERVTYPTVATPLGTQPVFQLTYPGQVENITANGQTTTAWQWAGIEYTNVAVKITGTWVGTLVFETSVDGTTWTAQTMTNHGSTPTASSTTSNVEWMANSSADRTPYDYFRVRASAWTSGTAVVYVGMQGGQAPARGDFGAPIAGQGKLYLRCGFRTSSGWNDNGNNGTKLVFFSKDSSGGQANNHYIGMTDGETGTVYPIVGAQTNGYNPTTNYLPSAGVAHGVWHDLEVLMEANSGGAANGILKVWMDGTLLTNRTDVLYFGNAMTAAFETGFYLDPTFGGGANPPVGQNIQIAQFYYESAA